MALFIGVVIYDLGKIFFRVFRSYVVRDCITSSHRNTRAEVLLLAFFLLKPFFGFFPSLLRGLHIADRIIYKLGLLDLWFRLFNLEVFYSNTLSLYLSHNNVSKMITLLDLVVYLSNIKNKLKTCFGLNLNRFLDYFFLSVQFSTSLLYLSFYKGFKVFSKESHKIELF